MALAAMASQRRRRLRRAGFTKSSELANGGNDDSRTAEKWAASEQAVAAKMANELALATASN